MDSCVFIEGVLEVFFYLCTLQFLTRNLEYFVCFIVLYINSYIVQLSMGRVIPDQAKKEEITHKRIGKGSTRSCQNIVCQIAVVKTVLNICTEVKVQVQS